MHVKCWCRLAAFYDTCVSPPYQARGATNRNCSGPIPTPETDLTNIQLHKDDLVVTDFGIF